MTKVRQIIDDVLTVALFNEKCTTTQLERQIEHSLAVIIPKRTMYCRAVVRAKVNRFKSFAHVEVDLFDSSTQTNPVAFVDNISPDKPHQPVLPKTVKTHSV